MYFQLFSSISVDFFAASLSTYGTMLMTVHLLKEMLSDGSDGSWVGAELFGVCLNLLTWTASARTSNLP
jgi:hypothetical protein